MAFSYHGRSNLPGPVVNNRFIITPPTTDMALVFPLDQRKVKFDRNFYSPALTDGKISSDAWNYSFVMLKKFLERKLAK